MYIEQLFLQYIIPNISQYNVINPTYTLTQMNSITQQLHNNNILFKHNELRNSKYIHLIYFSFILDEIYNILTQLIPHQEEYNRLSSIEKELI